MSTLRETAAESLWRRLSETTSLVGNAPELEALWLAVSDTITTRGTVTVTPIGCNTPIRVSSEHATVELIAAWEWLTANESVARALEPATLYVALRGAATRSARGSGRAARADAMCGLTDVPSSVLISIDDLAALEGVAA